MTSEELKKMQEAASICMREPLQDNNWVRYHDDLTEATPIMRFMTRKYFLEMIETRRNTLMHVSTWPDVYEGLIYRQKYFTQINNVKHPVSLERVYADYFGQCWTKSKYDSEILWNARCPNKDGVCIKTTVGCLANSISRTMPQQYLQACCRLGGVEYRDETKLKMWLNQYAASALSNFIELIDMFFVKREEFGDENEVRLLYVHDTSNLPWTNGFVAKKQFVQYDISASDFLSEVVLDPRMTESECQEIRCAVCKANWMFNGKALYVHQSSLYKAPENEFII